VRAVALALLVAVVAGCAGTEARPGAIGAKAPQLDAPAIVDGARVRTADLGGGGYLVNFWGSWCEPCKRELPRLAAVSPGTRIVGVAVRSSNRLARELLDASGATWPSASDPEGAIAARWGVASGFPVTVAVDRAGVIRGRHFGELSDADVAALVALVR
jgi:thiol-disulfide isomerase/thioredoxin